MISFDETIFLWINGLAGKVAIIDEFFKGIANDYFVIVSFCLVLLVLWFGTRKNRQREENQKGVIYAATSMGIAQGFVQLFNLFFFRTRPFEALADTNLIFYSAGEIYGPHDSSFPSNSTAAIFAIAVAIFLADRKAGTLLLFLACLHGFARIYVGIHYPLDVVGGAITGVLAAFLVFGLSRLLEPWPSRLLQFVRKFYLA